MDEQEYLVMDDRAEHWKSEHPEEFAALEEKNHEKVREIIQNSISKYK